jgi:hypothetical protein
MLGFDDARPLIYPVFLMGVSASASLWGASSGAQAAPVMQKTEVMDR